MPQGNAIVARLRTYREVLWRPWGKAVSALYGLLGIAQTIYAFSEWAQKQARGLSFILEWPWHYWATLVLTTTLIASLEGAYRMISAERASMARLQGELQIARGGSEPKVPECMRFGSVGYRGGLKFFYFYFESPPDGTLFRVFCDRDVEGVLVGAMTENDPFHSIGTTILDRRETSFSFLFPQEYIQTVTFIDITLQPTSVRIVEIRQA